MLNWMRTQAVQGFCLNLDPASLMDSAQAGWVPSQTLDPFGRWHWAMAGPPTVMGLCRKPPLWQSSQSCSLTQATNAWL